MRSPGLRNGETKANSFGIKRLSLITKRLMS